MILDLLRAVQSQPVYWLSLYKFINEVCCFKTPTRRHLVLSNLYLFRQNVISDFFPSLSDVRAFSIHALVSNDTHSKVINSDSMVLSAHHLRCYITPLLISINYSYPCILEYLMYPLHCQGSILGQYQDR